MGNKDTQYWENNVFRTNIKKMKEEIEGLLHEELKIPQE